MGEFRPRRRLNGGVEDGDGRIDVVIIAMVTWAHWLAQKRRREMSDQKPSLSDRAAEALPAGSQGELLQAFCMPTPPPRGSGFNGDRVRPIGGKGVGTLLAIQALQDMRQDITGGI
jgi:hypothetical protein